MDLALVVGSPAAGEGQRGADPSLVTEVGQRRLEVDEDGPVVGHWVPGTIRQTDDGPALERHWV